jgi:PAS domain S-box-containing protein
MFTHAPVSLWEEDFSEVRRRFDQLRSNGVEDLRKHFKKRPEEVLSLARMIRIVRVNNQTLTLYDAAGPVEFREGLSPIFNKDSFEVFKEELVTFWKGRTSFASEAINLTLNGTSKNILIHTIIPPGFEQTWARIYVAITDITTIKDSMRNLAVSEQKYRSVFDTVQTAILLVDVPSGIIIEANKSAKRLFGASNGELMGLHLTDLVPGEEQDKVHALLRNQAERPGPAGPVLHVRHKSNGTIPVIATADTIEIGSANVVVVSFTPADEAAPMRSADRRARVLHAGLSKKITQREREILRLVCSGKTSRVISQQLCISNKTVETHRARIMQKLDTHCVVDLVKFAMANGLARLQCPRYE